MANAVATAESCVGYVCVFVGYRDGVDGKAQEGEGEKGEEEGKKEKKDRKRKGEREGGGGGREREREIEEYREIQYIEKE